MLTRAYVDGAQVVVRDVDLGVGPVDLGPPAGVVGICEAHVAVVAGAHAELDAFVAEARDADDWLWVGSPGLAVAWGRRLAHVSPRAPSPGARPARRVLTAVGSLNRVSRRQLAVVTSASEGREDLTVLATPDEVEGDPAQAIEALARDVLALERMFGHDGDAVWIEAYCPMAFDDKGAAWLQPRGTIHNPYFGAAMLVCGEARREFLPVAGSAPAVRTEGGK